MLVLLRIILLRLRDFSTSPVALSTKRQVNAPFALYYAYAISSAQRQVNGRSINRISQKNEAVLLAACCMKEHQQPVPVPSAMCTSVIGAAGGQLATRKRRTCPRWRAERTPIPSAAGEPRADHAGRRRRARVGVRRGAAGTRMGSAAHAGVRRGSVARDRTARDISSSILRLPPAFHSKRASQEL